jgi:hypothetical protein
MCLWCELTTAYGVCSRGVPTWAEGGRRGVGTFTASPAEPQSRWNAGKGDVGGMGDVEFNDFPPTIFIAAFFHTRSVRWEM